MTRTRQAWDKEVRAYVRDMEKRGWEITETRRGHARARHPDGATVGISGGNDHNRNFANLQAAVRRAESAPVHHAEEHSVFSMTAGPDTTMKVAVDRRPALVQRGNQLKDGRFMAVESPSVERWTYSDGTTALRCRVCGREGTLKGLVGHFANHVKAGEAKPADLTTRRMVGPFDPSEVEQRVPYGTQKRPHRMAVVQAPTPKATPAPSSDAEATLDLIRDLVSGPQVEELAEAHARIADLEAQVEALRGALSSLADLANGSL